MDDPIIKQEYNEKNEDSDDDSDDSTNSNNWNIKYEDEKKFWENIIENNYIYKPAICPACNTGNYNIKEYNNKNINKLFYCRCDFKSCRKRVDLRFYSIFKINNNIPASVIFKIIDLFFFESQNAKQITDKINLKYKSNIYNYVVENILKKIRLIIFSFMDDKYKTTMIGGFDDLNRPIDVAIDESLLIHKKYTN